MKAELKQKWVEALRSGKYKQGTRWLKRTGAYCCLGVLCEVVRAEGVLLVTHENDSMLHQSDMDLVGLSKADMCYLSSINDNGVEFPEIANYIEDNI